jgi:hypothetical protein
MNTAQIQARKAYLDAEAKSMDAAPTEAVESKSYDILGDLEKEKRVSQLAADRAELEQAEATAGGDLVSAWPVGDRFCLAIRPTDFSFLLYE